VLPACGSGSSNGSPSASSAGESVSGGGVAAALSERPDVCERMCRTVTGRAGVRRPVSGSSTCLFAYDGSHFAIGSSSMNLPSSHSIIRAVETIGLVIEASEKMASFSIGWFSSL
jgi:hypothetical protein